MKHIEQTYTIAAPVEKVWQALTTAEVAEQWGAGPAQVDARKDGEFSYWGGDIHGLYTKVLPYQCIEQIWYGHNNPALQYTVRFTFEQQGNTTYVYMRFAGDIKDEQKDIADWDAYYFKPIKELLESE